MSCDMATPHEMKTWRRSRSPLKDTAIRPFERTLNLDKRQQPTRNFTMLREMKQRLKDLEGQRGDVSAQINDADISALKSEIEALEKVASAEVLEQARARRERLKEKAKKAKKKGAAHAQAAASTTATRTYTYRAAASTVPNQ